ncbi:MAG TPA: hypothetical protein VGR96_02785 [Acidobacteriaceae bacterium]|nr:hypothetical protein [Acidobacteriaceae bacterium]
MANSQKLIEILSEVIAGDMANQNSIIQFFLNNNYLGGWEGWLQVTYARAIASYERYNQFDREKQYPGIGQKCDLWFQPQRGAEMWVELKAQRRANYTNTVVDFGGDVLKLMSLGTDFRSLNVTAAMAVLVLSDGDRQILNAYRAQSPSGRLNYYLYSQQSPNWTDVTDSILTVQTNSLMLITFRPV